MWRRCCYGCYADDLRWGAEEVVTHVTYDTRGEGEGRHVHGGGSWTRAWGGDCALGARSNVRRAARCWLPLSDRNGAAVHFQGETSQLRDTSSNRWRLKSGCHANTRTKVEDIVCVCERAPVCVHVCLFVCVCESTFVYSSSSSSSHVVRLLLFPICS